MSMKQIKAGGAYVTIGLRNRIAAGANAVQADLRKLGAKLQSQGQSIMRVGIMAGTGAAGLLAGPVKAASEMQETMGKFDVVFGKNAKAVQKWSEATAAALGTSRQEMAAMLSGMQDLLVPMGVLPDAAEGMSKELSQLAVDLGSFNNRETSMVFDDLMAALTGSGEVMKKYGVVLTEAAVKQELLNQGMNPKNATDAQKAQARMNIILRGTTAAQGDALRTAGSFANQMKRLKSTVIDTAAAVGGPLLDDLASLVSIASGGITAFRDFIDKNKELARAIGIGLVAVTGLSVGLVTIGGTMAIAGMAASGVAATIGVLGASLGFLLSPLAAAVAGVTALGVGLVMYTDLGANAIDWLSSRFGPLVETVSSAAGSIMQALQMGDIQGAWELALSLMELAWLDLTDEIRDIWAAVSNYVLDIGSNMAEGIGMAFQALGGVLDSLLSKYEKVYNSIYDTVIEAGGKLSGVRTVGGTGNAFESNFGGAKADMKAAFAQIRRFGETMQDSARSQRDQRHEDRQAAREERIQRMESLREQITTQQQEITKAAVESENGRQSELDKVQQEIANKQKAFAANEAGMNQEQGRTGPSGSFSAFAATFVGMSGMTNEQRENRKVSVLERIEKNTAKGQVARFA